MTDPVAEKSGFLCMYMSNHPDTLVAYAKWFGKVQEVITSAKMTRIDTKGMTLKCMLKDGATKEVRIPIEPPLSGYEDVKPRLLEMKAFAQEGLGMIKAPKITNFALGTDAYISFVFTALIVSVYFAQGKSYPISGVADFIVGYTGPLPIAIPAWIFIVFHPFEALYTFSLCRKHSTGLYIGGLHVGATLLAGMPVWTNLRRRIQAARIDSVMKIQ